MEQVSDQVLFQRIRNRVIELFELYQSLEDVAQFGAFETLNMADDWLPVEYERAPLVFSQNERDAVDQFLAHIQAAAATTGEDTWDVDWLRNSTQWIQLSMHANLAAATFAKRGRFSEEREETFQG
ncbi:MAG: hypothetical protein AAGF30_05255 [Pseudomonadota bacterium]